MPSARQASRIVEPAGTVTATPSIVISTAARTGAGGASGGRLGRAGGPEEDVGQRLGGRRLAGVRDVRRAAPDRGPWTGPSPLTAPPAPAGGARSRSPSWPSGRGRRSRRRASPGRSRGGGRARRRACRVAAARDASRASSSSWRTVPTRHGTHWPHDSSRKKRAIRVSAPTMSAVSSKTMTTPEPRVAPIARVASNVSGVSSASGPTKTPAAPPSRTAFGARAAGDAAGELEQLASVTPNSTS